MTNKDNIKETIKILVSENWFPPLLIAVIGVILLISGSAGGLALGNFAFKITDTLWRIVVASFGGIFILVGLVMFIARLAKPKQEAFIWVRAHEINRPASGITNTRVTLYLPTQAPPVEVSTNNNGTAYFAYPAHLSGSRAFLQATRTGFSPGELVEITLESGQTFDVPLGTEGEKAPEENVLNRYLSFVVENFQSLAGLKFGRDIPLEGIYISPNMKADPALQQYIERQWSDINKIDESSLLKSFLANEFPRRRMLIEGRAGSGKTTLLRAWSLHLADAVRQSAALNIPVLVSLSAISKNYPRDKIHQKPIPELAAEQVMSRDDALYDELVNSLRARYIKGQIVILLDAADEVEEESRPHMLEWLRWLSEPANPCPIILTSRLYVDYISPLSNFHRFTMLEFGRDQIERFISLWFRVAQDRSQAEGLHQILVANNNKTRLLELTSNPLFLTMICMTYELDKKLIGVEAHLLNRFARILLKEWDRDKGVSRRTIRDGTQALPLELELLVLEEFSYSLLKQNQNNFTDKEAYLFISEYLIQSQREDRAESLMHEYTDTSGIFTFDAFGNGRFYHPLFRDLFAAQKLAGDYRQGKLNFKAWTKKYGTDPYYYTTSRYLLQLIDTQE